MRLQTRIETSEGAAVSPPAEPTRLRSTFDNFAKWLSVQLDRANPPRLNRTQLALVCAGIFVFALGVRALHWQDSYSVLEQKGQWMAKHARHYKSEGLRMLDEGGILFPRGHVDPGDARLILHPPGYSAFLAGIFTLSGNSDFAVMLAQITLDAISAVLILLIAAEFFNYAVAAIAGVLASLSPHFAHYSLWISPDTLCVLPILAAVYLTIKTVKRPRLLTVICAGAMVGISCWLRANALLLAPFLAVVLFLLIERGKRMRYSAALVGATVLVVMPITVRNWILFHHFIPISIAGGENLVVGIADFDKEGRFGMPASDADVGEKEAVWYNRPDYAATAWLPDGVERDQARYRRGLEVIRANPRWFLGVSLKRAFFMLRSNDFSRADWPFNTSKVPIVSAEPALRHSSALSAETEPEWSRSAEALISENFVIVAPRAHAEVDAAGGKLRIIGDDSLFGDQFASAPIAVKRGTDYLLRLRAAVDQGPAAAKVTSSDLNISLGSEILEGKDSKAAAKEETENDGKDGARISTGTRLSAIQMLFATGDRNEIRLVISNNGVSSARPVVEIGQVELFHLGETPFQWTRYPRAVVRGLQKNLFKTDRMLPLIIAGALLLAVAHNWRALVVLLAVPFYYLIAQSPLSTEYRYILAIHYFLFVQAAVALTSLGGAVAQAAGRFLPPKSGGAEQVETGDTHVGAK
jgi:dolichyl-phosphate-mannose-protein mannosyltransferase